jgi:hypothetical protein
MNELVARSTTELALQSDDPFADLVREEGSRSIRGSLLRFNKGDWLIGQDDTEVPPGTQFVANIPELLRGWVRWQDKKPTDHIMGKVYDRFQMPRRDELGDLDKSQWETDVNGRERDPWQKTYYLLLKGTEKNSDELYTFAASSKGGIDAVLALCDAYSRGKRKQVGEVLPVIALSGSSYQHPNRELGRVKTPEFKLVGWVPATVFNDLVNPETGEVQEKIPF